MHSERPRRASPRVAPSGDVAAGPSSTLPTLRLRWSWAAGLGVGQALLAWPAADPPSLCPARLQERILRLRRLGPHAPQEDPSAKPITRAVAHERHPEAHHCAQPVPMRHPRGHESECAEPRSGPDRCEADGAPTSARVRRSARPAARYVHRVHVKLDIGPPSPWTERPYGPVDAHPERITGWALPAEPARARPHPALPLIDPAAGTAWVGILMAHGSIQLRSSPPA